MTTPKGGKRGGGKPGNRNTIHGPRLGRKSKPVTSKVPAQRLPSPKPVAKLPQRRRHTKTGGKPFAPGQNSHDGTIFRRTADMLPRGNFTLMNRIVFADARLKIYQRHMAIIESGTNLEFLRQQEMMGNRMEGLPTKKVETAVRPAATFYLTQPDGTVTPLLPPRPVGQGATPAASAAAPAEEAVILALEEVRL